MVSAGAHSVYGAMRPPKSTGHTDNPLPDALNRLSKIVDRGVELLERDVPPVRGPGLHRFSTLGLLTSINGWQDAFKRIEDPPVQADGRLECVCGSMVDLVPDVLVACECHRSFLVHGRRIYVAYRDE